MLLNRRLTITRGCQFHAQEDAGANQREARLAAFLLDYFGLRRVDGTDQVIHDLLRWQVREGRSRREDRPRS
ncbi:hypothetical protein [Streptomyces sp. ADI92-24]|uniref:hypothetical protein n=1 Tax=Streptomyces sp. ADI92-24 TaxID=1522756 RepID=UPI0019CF548B|nr:hypothetical protein [Streptomyces sp. ADI92-24]